MVSTKQDISYQFPTLERKNSTVISSDTTFSPYRRPSSGYSTDSRFFAKNETDDAQYIVKRILPKKIELYGQTPEKRSILFDCEAKAFERELAKWNIVYPDKKGTMVLNKKFGPRLILPCLPGKELGWWLSNIEFGDKSTTAKVWLAVAYALRDLATKNLYQNDILEPNILVHNQDNELFQAYVIDFGSVASSDCNIGRPRVCEETKSLTGNACKGYDDAISNLNAYIASFSASKGSKMEGL